MNAWNYIESARKLELHNHLKETMQIDYMFVKGNVSFNPKQSNFQRWNLTNLIIANKELPPKKC